MPLANVAAQALPRRHSAARAWHGLLVACCLLVCIFLVAPIIVIIPLSFNASPFFTLPIEAFSWRWYESFFSSETWRAAIRNSVVVACCTTVLATCIGTVGALGLARLGVRLRTILLAVYVAPMVVPAVVSAVAIYYFFATIGLTGSIAGLVLAHTVLGIPFVVITVSAALEKFDRTLERAALSLGASPRMVFRTVTLPAILPGVISGAIFAFVTSWDEVVVTIFVASPGQFTLPRQMWAGIRENVNPTLLAVAVFLTLVSVILMATAAFVGWRRAAPRRERRT
jgi:putative spermidine/putrescine transport system permease protein